MKLESFTGPFSAGFSSMSSKGCGIKPDISLIIGTFNRKKCLQRALESLAGLPEAVSELEVIVADDGSDDGTEEAVKSLISRRILRILYVRSPTREGISAARKRAIKIATGKFLVFTDDDCLFDESWLKSLLNPLRRKTAEISGGPDKPPPDAPFFRKCIGYLFTSFIGTGGLRSGGRFKVAPYYPKGCNMAVRREVIWSVGGFTEGLQPGEEVELVYRAKRSGYQVAYVPEAGVFHDRQLNLFSLLNKIYGIGHIRTVLARKHPGLLYFGHTIPFLCLLGIILTSLLALFSDFFVLLLTILVCSYAVFLFTGAVLATRTIGDLRALFVMPFLLCAFHTAHAIGFAKGVFEILFQRDH